MAKLVGSESKAIAQVKENLRHLLAQLKNPNAHIRPMKRCEMLRDVLTLEQMLQSADVSMKLAEALDDEDEHVVGDSAKRIHAGWCRRYLQNNQRHISRLRA